MNTLERYIFKKIVFAGLGAALAIFAVVWVSQAVSRMDFATGTGASMGAFVALLVAISPQLMSIALPFGLIMGIVKVLNELNSGAEMSAMAGSGVSRWSIAKPVFILCAAASAYTLFSSHFIEPSANQAKRDIVTEARTDLLTTLINPGQFRKLERDIVIYVDSKSPGNLLNGLMMADLRDPKNQLIYYAQSAQATKNDGIDMLLMSDGQIHRRSDKDNAVSIIKFASYAVSLSEFSAAANGHAYKVIERPTSELTTIDPNDSYLQDRFYEAKAEVQRRNSDWLYPMLFGALALALAGHPASSRQTHVITMGLAFGAALVYRGFAYYVYGESAGTSALIWLMYAVPIGAFALNCVLYFRGIVINLSTLTRPFGVVWRYLARYLPTARMGRA